MLPLVGIEPWPLINLWFQVQYYPLWTNWALRFKTKNPNQRRLFWVGHFIPPIQSFSDIYQSHWLWLLRHRLLIVWINPNATHQHIVVVFNENLSARLLFWMITILINSIDLWLITNDNRWPLTTFFVVLIDVPWGPHTWVFVLSTLIFRLKIYALYVFNYIFSFYKLDEIGNKNAFQ